MPTEGFNNRVCPWNSARTDGRIRGNHGRNRRMTYEANTIPVSKVLEKLENYDCSFVRILKITLLGNMGRKIFFLGKNICKLLIIFCIVPWKNIIRHGSSSVCNLNEWEEKDSEIYYIRNERVIEILETIFPLLIVHFFFMENIERRLEISS